MDVDRYICNPTLALPEYVIQSSVFANARVRVLVRVRDRACTDLPSPSAIAKAERDCRAVPSNASERRVRD